MTLNNFITFTCFGLIYLLTLVHVSSTLNLGLISGDVKRNLDPLIKGKTPHDVTISTNKKGFSYRQILYPPILPLNLSPIKRRIKKSIKSPKIPKLPLLPLLPPILPPLLPKIPLLPLPILPLLPPPLLPIVPGLKKLKKPIKVPIIGKTKLRKALKPKIRLSKGPSLELNRTKKILDRLIKLKRDGSLTTSQYIRFRKLLL